MTAMMMVLLDGHPLHIPQTKISAFKITSGYGDAADADGWIFELKNPLRLDDD